MNSNKKYNQAAIKQFRKELTDMLGDIMEIDIKCLNKAVNAGVADAKRNTNVSESGNVVDFTTRDGTHVHFTTSTSRVGGFMRKSWRAAPAVKSKSGGVTKSMVNSADYSEYVNYGHRLVNSKGETKGFVKGQFILEKAINVVDKTLEKEFKKEVERVNK